MDRKLNVIVKKLSLASIIVFGCCLVFADLRVAKGVSAGFVVFCVNIVVLATSFNKLLDNSQVLSDSKSKQFSLLVLSLKIPVLVAVLYYLLRVLNFSVINVFLGSILGMLMSGWLFFEDYLKGLTK